ncbi:MAG: FeoB-associated Cys-rich membrane protein [Oscillospiraceae bacterium]
MLHLITENLGTIAVCAVIALLLALDIAYIVRKKKNGAACIGCSGCNATAKPKADEPSCQGSCSCCAGCATHQKAE